MVILSNEQKNSRKSAGGVRGGYAPQATRGVMASKASHFGCTSHVTTNTKANSTIQQGRVFCTESYTFNIFQNFDGTSHGIFVLSHGRSTALLDNTHFVS